MRYAKIFGWVLLMSGIILIGWTLITSYNMFTGKTELPQIFIAPIQEVQIEKPITQQNLQQQLIQQQLQMMLQDQLKDILPADSLTKILNLSIWSMLAFLLMSGGSRISNLGVQLIKTKE